MVVGFSIAGMLSLAACVVAVIHLGFSRKIDLSATVFALGVAAWLAGWFGPVEAQGAHGSRAALLGVAAFASALATVLGARRGIGRPDLLAIACAAGSMATLAITEVFEGEPVWTGVVEALLVLIAVVTALLSAERARLPGHRVLHYRDIPVQPGGSHEDRVA